MRKKSYNKRSKIRSPEQNKQRLTRLLSAFLILLVIVFLFELCKPLWHRLTTPQKHTITLAIPDKTIKTSAAPTYDFYQTLPKMSLQSLTLKNLKDQTKALNIAVPATKKTNQTYTLQIASVKDVDQATQLAAKINALKNIGDQQAQVTMLTRHHTPWYAVRLGPFQTRAAAENMQNILDRAYYSGMILVNSQAIDTPSKNNSA